MQACYACTVLAIYHSVVSRNEQYASLLTCRHSAPLGEPRPGMTGCRGQAQACLCVRLSVCVPGVDEYSYVV